MNTSILMSILFVALSTSVFAHCDTYDGPVVKDAQLALEKKDVTPVLKWVHPDDEKGVKELYEAVIKVRGGSKDAQQLADMYFFETVVRLHRRAEGQPYFGIKPPGMKINPAVAAADEAITQGNVDKLATDAGKAVENAIRHKYKLVADRLKEKNSSVKEGRFYVEAYIEFTHFMEELYIIMNPPVQPDVTEKRHMEIIIRPEAED